GITQRRRSRPRRVARRCWSQPLVLSYPVPVLSISGVIRFRPILSAFANVDRDESGKPAGTLLRLPYHRSMITPTNSLPDAVSLAGRVCLISGGSRGIGRAIAKMLLLEGAEVAICGRSRETVDAATLELSAETGGKVKGQVADVRKHEEVGALFQF